MIFSIRKNWIAYLLPLVAICVISVGCQPGEEGGSSDKKEQASNDHDDHDHDEGGGHSHAHGPNGDVVFHIDDAELHAEITTDKATKTAKITFCSEDGKNEEAVKISAARIFYEDMSFDLAAEGAGEDGAASVFVSEESDDLLTLIKSRPNFEFEMDGKKFEVRLPRPH